MKQYVIQEQARALNAATAAMQQVMKTTAHRYLETAIEKLEIRRNEIWKHLERSSVAEYRMTGKIFDKYHEKRQALWTKYFEVTKSIETILDIIAEL